MGNPSIYDKICAIYVTYRIHTSRNAILPFSLYGSLYNKMNMFLD